VQPLAYPCTLNPNRSVNTLRFSLLSTRSLCLLPHVLPDHEASPVSYNWHTVLCVLHKHVHVLRLYALCNSYYRTTCNFDLVSARAHTHTHTLSLSWINTYLASNSTLGTLCSGVQFRLVRLIAAIASFALNDRMRSCHMCIPFSLLDDDVALFTVAIHAIACCFVKQTRRCRYALFTMPIDTQIQPTQPTTTDL
jgi:hypothetical protein